MFIYGLIAIMGAGWIEPAGIGRQPGRDQLLVQADHRKDKNTRNIPKCTRHISQARFMGIIMQDKLLFRVLVHPVVSSAESSLARVRRLVNAERVSARVEVTSAGLAIRIRSQPEAMEGIRLRMASRKSRFARLR